MNKAPVKPVIHCAIYTRKSTEEGLQQEFNTLDAQRESGEAFIAAQKHEGWRCLPDRYDDGGFTGGNMERPALARLLKDIESGKVNCVVVYKVDRLSRSLLDFSRIMETFEKNKVSFVSVTQQFNTTHSMGRLTLNILLSFAQFEREIISERTRDKIAAARRKGKFAGGRPVLGYDLLSSAAGPKLLVNPDEAKRVKAIFELYAQHQALIPTVTELNERHWTTKLYQTKVGKSVGGRIWGKTELFKLLTNVVYIGKVRHHDEVHPGEHTGIISAALWQKVQAILRRNGKTGGALVRNKHGALLKGMLRCTYCNCSMGHSYTVKGSKRYRYYVCLSAQKRGWDTCPAKSVPAGEIERFVVDQIKRIGSDPALVAQTIRQAQKQHKQAVAELRSEELANQRAMKRHGEELRRLAASAGNGDTASRLADLQDRIRQAEQRASEITQQMAAMSHQAIDERDARQALALFDPVWGALSPREQARIIQLLVERVDYDGKQQTISVTFRPNGIKALALETKEIAA